MLKSYSGVLNWTAVDLMFTIGYGVIIRNFHSIIVRYLGTTTNNPIPISLAAITLTSSVMIVVFWEPFQTCHLDDRNCSKTRNKLSTVIWMVEIEPKH